MSAYISVYDCHIAKDKNRIKRICPFFLPNRSLLFAFAEDTESWEQRQTKISFPTWLCRTVSYLRSDKDTKNQEQKQIYLIIPRGILYSIYFNNLFNFCPKNKNPRRLLYTPRGFFLSCIYRFTILYVLFWIRHKYTPRLRADMSKVIAPP